MFPLMSKIAASVLMSAATFTNPTNPKALSFDASAYITVNNEIRVAVQKSTDVPVQILLRDKEQNVVYQKNIGKKDDRYAVKLNVNELADGQYELEFKSSEGSIRKQVKLSTTPVQNTGRIIAMQ